MFKKIKFPYYKRSEQGSLGTLLLSLSLLIMVALGSLASDIAHEQSVIGELQNATDAAALAGAQDFLNDDNAMVDQDTADVAASNTADGRSVSLDSPDTNVNINVNYPLAGSDGSVEVTAAMKIKNLLAPIFGALSQTVQVKSEATYYPTVSSLGPNQFFPITPSLTDTSAGPALGTLSIGDPVTISIQPSGGNAAWTSGTGNMPKPSTPVIQAAVDIALGLTAPNAELSPAMAADGTNAVALTQGLHNGVDLSGGSYPSLMQQKPFLVMPVISGGKPYNQNRTLLGFICVKVSGISTGSDSLTISGTLVKGLVQGTGGILPSGGGGLTNLSPGTVKLVQAQS